MDAVVGREPELRRLTSALLRAQSGEGGTILVEGAAGIGKTTLLEAFRDAVTSAMESAGDPDERPMGLATGSCFELAAGEDSYEPFKELLRGLVSPRQREGVGRLVLELLKENAPDLLSLVPGLGVAARVGLRSAAIVGDWSLGADQGTRADLSESVAHQYAEAFFVLAEKLSPLVLVIEDAHWIDRASAQLLFRLAKLSRASSLLIVVTYRPAYLQGSALDTVLRELMILNTTDVVSLEGFTEEQLADYLEARYGTRSYDSNLPAWLNQVSGGSPMFVAQYLSLLEEEGILRRTAASLVLDRELRRVDGEWRVGYSDQELPMPRTVKELLTQRIEKLEDRDRKLLELGSVQGLRFMSVVLMSMASTADEDLLRELRRIEREGQVIREELPEPWARRATGLYAFEHSLFRQAFYGELGRRERQNYHAIVARALVELLGSLREDDREPPRRLILEIAHHLRAAEEYGKAAEYGLLAAESCYAEGAFGEVATLGQAVLADLARDDTGRADDVMYAKTIRILLATSEPQWFATPATNQPSLDELIARARTAASRAGDGQMESQLLFLSGRNLVVTGRLDLAVETFEQARSDMHDLGDVFGEISAMIESGHHQIALDPTAAMSKLRRAQQILETERDAVESHLPSKAVARIRHRLRGTIGIAAFDHGRFDDALRDLDDSVGGLADEKMVDLYLLHANFLAQALIATGQFDRAEALLRDAIDAGGTNVAGRIPTAYNRALLGKLYLEWERPELAIDPLETAWTDIQKTPDNSILPIVANYYAELLMAPVSLSSDPEKAATVLRWSLSHSRQFGFERSAIAAQCLQARLALTHGDVPTALAASGSAAEALWKAQVMPAVRAEEVYFVHGQVLRAAHRHEEADTWMARAREVLDAKARSLGDEAIRRQFLEHVPTSRSLVQSTTPA
jgi:tetratricopeptide (TPR) repeat protein